MSRGLVALGAAVGMLPTAWTVVVPVLAVVVVVLNVVDAGLTYDAAPRPIGSDRPSVTRAAGT